MLSLLLLWYIFWPVSATLAIIAYACVHDEDDFAWWSALWSTLFVGLLAWRYDAVYLTLTSWPGVVYALAAYMGAGALVAAYKWGMTLVDFKEKAPEWLAEHVKYTRGDYISKENALSKHLYDSEHKVNEAKLREQGDAPVTIYYPRWQGFPIANWVAYWPLFSVSVIVDPLWRAAKRMVKWAGVALEGVAKRFAVS